MNFCYLLKTVSSRTNTIYKYVSVRVNKDIHIYMK